MQSLAVRPTKTKTGIGTGRAPPGPSLCSASGEKSKGRFQRAVTAHWLEQIRKLPVRQTLVRRAKLEISCGALPRAKPLDVALDEILADLILLSVNPFDCDPRPLANAEP